MTDEPGSYVDPEEYFTSATPVDLRRVKLVTVHGTNAGDVSSFGDGWWQWGSDFQTELGQRIDIDTNSGSGEILPLHWDIGPNSEKFRREAGVKLFECLKLLEDAGADYCVVGHSHGGSVLYKALLQSVENDHPLERLKSWCTVGTPFLDYRQNYFLFQRLEGIPLALCATGIVGFIVGVVTLFYIWLGDQVNNESDVKSLGEVFIAYGVISISAMYLHELRNKDWFTFKQKQKVSEWYANRWLGLWHPQDEAISALSNIRRVKFKLIKNEFLKPLVGIMQLLFVTFYGSLILKDIVSDDAEGLLTFFYFSPKTTTDGLSANSEPLTMAGSNSVAVESLVFPAGDIVGTLISFGYYLIIFFVFLATISWILNKAIVPIGAALAWPLNQIILGTLRRASWGDDLVKEDVHDISYKPPAFPEKRGPLPELVSKPLRSFSEINAIKTLENVRKVLGMTSDSSPNVDLGTDLEATLNWKELIHTSYFHVPEFIDLIAIGLHQTGVAKLKESFTMTPEREELAAWIAGNAEQTSNVDELETLAS